MVAALAHQPRLDLLDEAESVILGLSAVLLGGDDRGAGLLRKRVDDRFHTARCPIGQYLTPGLGGDPCSDRCIAAREALDAATRWLRAREGMG